MPDPDRPRLTVGLPVFNGEQYLATTLDTLLAQTYGDFEIIISDNASTDATGVIGQTYATLDPRVRYVRQERNVGAAENYNRTFALARGELFKWAAYDDLCRPRFLEACVAALDAPGAEDVALVHPASVLIDADGALLRADRDDVSLDDGDPAARFAHVLGNVRAANAVFGVFRSELLAATALIAPYPGSDWMLLAETALHGRIRQLDDVLFERRIHERASMRAIQISGGGRRAEVAWFAGSGARLITWIPFDVHSTFVLARAVRRARLRAGQRLRSLLAIPTVYWPRLVRFRGGRIKQLLRGRSLRGPAAITREG